MRFDISIIAKDDGWSPSGGAIAALHVSCDSNWIALRPDDVGRMAEFHPSELKDLDIIDEKGRRFRYVPMPADEKVPA